MTFTLIMTPAAIAAKEYIIDSTDLAPEGGNFIVDETETLTVAQIDALNKKAAALLENRRCAVYVWIVDLVPENYARTMDTLEIYIDAFYNKYDLGCGDDKNGIVLLLEIGDIPGERDYALNTHGACSSAFTSGAKENLLEDSIVPLFVAAFSNGNFYRVADVFYDEVENKFVFYDQGTLAVKLAIVILVPILIASFVCLRWKVMMKTAKVARTADNYIPENGFNLTGKTDRFLYRTTTRRKIEKASPGGSGSSSSGRTSGGKV